MGAGDVRERLIEIESKLAFQERICEELSDVVSDQARQIDELGRRIEFLEARLRAGSGSPETDPLEERPPHY